jgi:hypothetical protein
VHFTQALFCGQAIETGFVSVFDRQNAEMSEFNHKTKGLLITSDSGDSNI